MRFYKYHGLGNDYLVMNPEEIKRELTPKEIIAICHRNYGIGSDGILWGPCRDDQRDLGLKIYNPDASEAEKSGNGLRIFSRYLWDQGLVNTDTPFRINTLGGEIRAKVMDNGKKVHVQMGRVSFNSQEIPVMGVDGDVLNEKIIINGKEYQYCAASVGNPHCVLLLDDISEDLARSIGPVIENDARFPNRTNVQFMKILDRKNIQIEIWERGAGYTLASGSSSSAAAAVAHKLRFCGPEISVHMPGGILEILIDDQYEISMTGPVSKVGEGIIHEDLFKDFPDFLIP